MRYPMWYKLVIMRSHRRTGDDALAPMIRLGNISNPYTILEPNSAGDLYGSSYRLILREHRRYVRVRAANLVVFLNGGRSPWNVELYDGIDTSILQNISTQEFHISVLAEFEQPITASYQSD